MSAASGAAAVLGGGPGSRVGCTAMMPPAGARFVGDALRLLPPPPPPPPRWRRCGGGGTAYAAASCVTASRGSGGAAIAAAISASALGCGGCEAELREIAAAGSASMSIEKSPPLLGCSSPPPPDERCASLTRGSWPPCTQAPSVAPKPPPLLGRPADCDARAYACERAVSMCGARSGCAGAPGAALRLRRDALRWA